MKCKLLLFIMLFVFTSVGWAQTGTVTGTLTDDQGPVIGATVFVKGASKESLRGTITDIDGKYSIKVSPNEVLVYSFIGYKNVEMPVNGQSVIDVVMELDMEVLEQVVVVGYGVQTKASSVGAIGVKKGEDLLKTGSITNLSEALQGQVAGLVSISKTSKPGADDSDMLIRGKSTWGNSNPLVLVDGIERNFNDVDFNEIETISVLKDASATAVFGVKGANGVILVTTKRGTSQKSEVSFTANFGIIQPTTSPDWSSYPDALRLFNEAKRNDNAWGGQVPQSTIGAWDNAIATGNYGPYNDVFPQVDWWDETVKKYGTNQSYNINIRGGSEKMRYFTSLGYLNEGDIYKSVANEEFDPAFYYKRYNWRSNFDFDLTSSTLLSVNIAGNMGYRNQPAYRGGSSDSDDAWFFKFYNQNSSNDFPIKYSDGEWGAAADGEGNLNIYLSESGARMYKSYQGMYDISLNQELDFFVKGLSAKGSFSYTNNVTTQSNIISGKIYGAADLDALNRIVRYNRVYDYANPITNADGTITYPILTNSRKQTATAIDDYPIGGDYDTFKGYSRKFYYELALNYKATFNQKHKVTGLALFNRKNEEFTKEGGLDYPVLEESWVGRGTYSYNEKYLLDLNGAYTGSEKFAPGKRFGFFYSFSLGWRLSEEEFIKSFIGENLSNLKVRYSYGTVGNDKGAPRFNYLQQFDVVKDAQSQFGLIQNYNYKPIYKEGKVADPDATWEESLKQNIGIDLGLWNKLNLTLDLFKEDRTQILMERNTVPAWVQAAVALPAANLGETKSHGLEVELGWNDKVKEVNYFAKLSFSTSENRIVYRDDPKTYDDYLKQAGKAINYQTKMLANGNFTSIDDIYNSAVSGISGGDQSKLVPGDLYYMDYNGDGQITPELDKVPHANVNYPLTTLGFSFGADWKGFGFNALLYGAFDVYKEQIDSYLWDFPTGSIKAQPNAMDRWTSNSPWQSGIIRPSVHLNNNYNATGSTYTYTTHDYIRLKNLEVNYALPKKTLDYLKLSRCQLFANASNLFTISSVDSRRDPENDKDSYPIVKRFNFGVRVGF